MAEVVKSDAKCTSCAQCPLQHFDHFRAFNEQELDFVTKFKIGELAVDKGTTIIAEGSNSAHLYTVLKGWACRHKILEDGRRQILNFALPGDLIGLQGSLMGTMQHSIEALTPVTLCVFQRDRLYDLFKKHASLAFDVTWIAAREESVLDEHLLSVGQRTAIERSAYLLLFLHKKAKAVNMITKAKPVIPITQSQIADTLGLSTVHTNKTLRKLANLGMARWVDGGCEVLDETGLMRISGWDGQLLTDRPYI